MRILRPFVLFGSLLLLSINAAAAQATTPIPAGNSPEGELLRWAVTQGGLVVVTLVVVWSYRRDFQRVFTNEQQRTAELILALQASTTAMTTQAEIARQQAEADREHAKAFLELSASVRACEAIRDTFVAKWRQDNHLSRPEGGR